MTFKVRRATPALGLDALEARTLLSKAPFGPAAAVSSSIFVRFAATASASQVMADLNAVGGQIATVYPDGTDLVRLSPLVDRTTAIQTLKARPGVVHAEADGAFHASGVTPARVTPNDPRLASEWGMGMIDAPYAWSITTGTPATIIAVLDTGIDLNNPEFARRIWTNPVANNDGHKGDLHGWNFVANTGNVADDDGHGTHVSGILAAAGNNAYGIAGVDWNAQIMPLKVLDSQGNGTTDSAISAVYFAVSHGARVINASWGGDTFSQAMLDALNYAASKGVVFVTAAGNDSVNNDSTPADPLNATTYPASYRTPNELVVAAIDQVGRLADFSNYGPNTVDLAAPGVGIVSTMPTKFAPGGFASEDGTSMATPFVSGTVALLAGANPGMTADQLVARVLATVKPLSQLKGLLIAAGVVDPLNALLNRQPLHSSAVPGGSAPALTPTPTPTPVAASFPTVEGRILSQDGVYSLFGATTSTYVTSIYQAIDGRAPTADELNYYSLALQSGQARLDFVGKLQNSAEGQITRVARWYVDELGSTAPLPALKADAGVRYYANLLATGSSVATVQGVLMSHVVSGFATPSSVVTYLYQAFLGRAPAAGDLAYYTAELNAGAGVAQVSQQFLSSVEGHLTAIAYLYRDELGSSAPIAALKADSGVAYWASLLGTN